MPGGMGVNLVKQYRQAGLVERVPFLSAFTVDESTLPAQQDAAVGLFGGMTWAPNMDNAGEQGLRRGLREGVRLRAGLLRHAGLRRRDADRLRAQGDGRQHRRQGGALRRRSARPTSSRLRGAVQVQRQRLSDPGLLPGEGRQARRRQVPDRDRREGLRRTTATCTRRTASRRASCTSPAAEGDSAKPSG